MITLIKKQELKTATWAGGTTTQLAIYPRTAKYSKFNFDYRISYATVEIEESTFTFMPGVTRHLMILKGALEIDHLNRYKKLMEKFDIDVFNGEWPTKAKGKVTDFNLMTRGKAEGSLEPLVLKKGEKKNIALHPKEHAGIYLLHGKLQIKNKNKALKMQEGDFVLLTQALTQTFLLSSTEACEIILAKVKLAG